MEFIYRVPGEKVARMLAYLGFIVLVIMAIWILIDVISGIFRWGFPGMVDWVEVLNCHLHRASVAIYDHSTQTHIHDADPEAFICQAAAHPRYYHFYYRICICSPGGLAGQYRSLVQLEMLGIQRCRN